MSPRRKPILNDQKIALRICYRLQPSDSNRQLTEWFNTKYNRPIAPFSLSEILSARYSWLDEALAVHINRARRRVGQWPELEAALFAWI
jgi:hypothetical protein